MSGGHGRGRRSPEQIRDARYGTGSGDLLRLVTFVAADGSAHLPITYLHSLRAGGYEVAHRDPFDRMLAAQSELERLALVTRDPAFSRFGVETLW